VAQYKTGWGTITRYFFIAVLVTSLGNLGIIRETAEDWSEPYEGYYLFLGDNPMKQLLNGQI